MKRMVLLMAGLWVCAAGGAARRPMTIDDVLALRHASDLQFAPDGSRVAFVLTDWERERDRYTTQVHGVDVAGGKVEAFTSGPKSAWHPRWNPRTGALAYLSDGDDGRAHVFGVVPGGPPRQLFAHAASISTFEWQPDGASLVFLARDPEPPVAKEPGTKPVVLVGEEEPLSRVWTFDGGTGRVRPLTDGRSHVTGVAVSPDGRSVAFAAQPSPLWPRFIEREVFLIPAEGGEPRQLTSNAVAESDLRWSPDGTRLSYLAATDGNVLGVGPSRVHVMTIAGGQTRALARTFDGYIDQYDWAPDRRSFIIAAGLGVTRHLYRLPVEDGPPQPLTDGDGAFGPFAADKQGRLVFLHQTPERPGDLMAKTDGAAPARRLTNLNPQAEEWALGRVETVRWKSADGLEIEGLVVYPVDYRAGRRYPTVMQVHGGPESAHIRRFMADWSNNPQVYAGAGYVTFLPNFRSSSNYGARFAHGAGANSAAAEDGVFADLMTGLDALVQRGLADPDRLGVKGWSYGGYMTSWIIGHSDRFKAAAYGAGDTNLVSYYGTASINPGFDVLNEAPYADFARWIQRSPLMAVAKVKTPCLIFQGEKDAIVPLGQSLEFHKALLHFHVPTRLVVYPGEPHGLTVPGYMRDKMQRELDWFERHLKPAAQPH